MNSIIGKNWKALFLRSHYPTHIVPKKNILDTIFNCLELVLFIFVINIKKLEFIFYFEYNNIQGLIVNITELVS